MRRPPPVPGANHTTSPPEVRSRRLPPRGKSQSASHCQGKFSAAVPTSTAENLSPVAERRHFFLHQHHYPPSSAATAAAGASEAPSRTSPQPPTTVRDHPIAAAHAAPSRPPPSCNVTIGRRPSVPLLPSPQSARSVCISRSRRDEKPWPLPPRRRLRLRPRPRPQPQLRPPPTIPTSLLRPRSTSAGKRSRRLYGIRFGLAAVPVAWPPASRTRLIWVSFAYTRCPRLRPRPRTTC